MKLEPIGHLSPRERLVLLVKIAACLLVITACVLVLLPGLSWWAKVGFPL